MRPLNYAAKLGTYSAISPKLRNDVWIDWLFWNEVVTVSRDYKPEDTEL